MRKANPNSFRQRILEQFSKGKSLEEVLEYFNAKGTVRELVVHYAYADYCSGARSIRG